mgnify:CR=1 FL=1
MSEFKNTKNIQSQRQLRVGELIRHIISDLLARDNIHDRFLNNNPITVSQVIVSPDMKWGKVFVSTLGGKEINNTISSLNKNVYRIQNQIAGQVRLRRMPKLKFVEDSSFKNAKKINDAIFSFSSLKDNKNSNG